MLIFSSRKDFVDPNEKSAADEAHRPIPRRIRTDAGLWLVSDPLWTRDAVPPPTPSALGLPGLVLPFKIGWSAYIS